MSARIEPGSFRDPDSRVVEADGGVLRMLSEQGLRDWQALAGSELFRRAVAEGKVVGTEIETDRDGLPEGLVDGAAAVLRHEVVPFVSYPYEWTFAMLKDAALLQLELLRGALDENLILKDSSPYNLQWHGAKPSSSTSARSSSCARASRGSATASSACSSSIRCSSRRTRTSPSSPGSGAGSTESSRRSSAPCCPFRDLFRARCAHATSSLHARLERRHADSSRDVKTRARQGRLQEGADRRERASGSQKLVSKLDWQPGASAWSDYGPRAHYTDSDTAAKDEFVRRVAGERERELVWDLGCNDGRYSRIAAEHAHTVVAMDADAAVVDGFYRSLRRRDA